MLVAPFITQRKNAPLAVLSDVIFDQTDFQLGTGSANLEGPLSLSIDVINTSTSPLYFGVEILTLSGAINVSDRVHIAFVPARIAAGQSQRRLIGPSSVPQLAFITGVIQKITIHFYAFTATPQASVQLFITPPVPVLSAPPYIGQDEIAIEPGVLLPISAVLNVGAGAVNVNVYDSGLLNYPFRHRIKSVSVGIAPSPVSQVSIFFYVSDVTSGLVPVFVRDSQSATITTFGEYYPNIVIPSSGRYQILANNTAAAAVLVSARILVEVLM